MITYMEIGDSDMTDADPTKHNVVELIEELDRLRQNQPTAEQKLKLAIFDQLPFTVWASTKDFKIAFWNRSCENNYGFTKQEALGKDFVDLFVDPLEAENSRQDVVDIVEQGKVFRNFLAWDHSKDGSLRTMLTNCFRIYDEERKEYLQVEIGVEVSDLELRKDEHRQLRDLAKTKREEKLKLLGLIRTEILNRINDEYRKRAFPLTAQFIAVEQYEQELAHQGTNPATIKELTSGKREQIHYELAQLTSWEKDLIARAANAQTLEELAEVRAEMDKLPK